MGKVKFPKVLARGLPPLILAAVFNVAHAEPVSGLTVACTATGPGVVACGGIGIVLNELTNFANGKEAFGPNGEVMKVVQAPVKIIGGNIAGMEREQGVFNKALRGVLGISIEDARTNIFGGPNSIFRRPFGT